MGAIDRTEPQVALDDERDRYEIEVGGTVIGFAAYRRRGDVLDFHHTEIDPAFEGRGHGARLVRAALDDVRARGLVVVPDCSFVRVFIDRHPAYQDLVAS